jgi:hypothetical protein
MSSLHESGLTRSELDAVEAALARDVALREELELIASFLEPRTRRIFWRAFASGCASGGRPAAAVLGALERAIAHRG